MLLPFTTILLALTLTRPAVALPLQADSESSALVERSDLEARAAASKVITTCTRPNTFALTFDDGPYPYGVELEGTFAKYKSKASFFVNGNNWACIYDNADDLIKRYKAGHLIGSHTWSHPDLKDITPAQLHKQLDLVEIALKKILGIKPRFFRPPFGSTTPATLKVLADRGYKVVNWSFDSEDTAGKTAKQSIALYDNLIKTQSPKPQMTLNHETHQTTTHTVIPNVVPKLIKKGYKLVTVAECLGLSPYQSVGKPSKRDSTWTCNGTIAPGKA